MSIAICPNQYCAIVRKDVLKHTKLELGAGMEFTTDLQIKKCKPTSNNEVKRFGKGLYVRDFLLGRKLFQIRYKQ